VWAMCTETWLRALWGVTGQTQRSDLMRATMMDAAAKTCWRRATEVDSSLAIADGLSRDLARRELRPTRYSRQRLFRAMARQETVVFRDFPLRTPLHRFFSNGADPGDLLKSLFGRSQEATAKIGPRQRRTTLRIHEIVDVWAHQREQIAANDVYFRTSKLNRAFDFAAITDFNVLHTGSAALKNLEIATVLMGSPGCMTDSHSDDPDGCNHCVFGKKLWLAWDRLEGQARGLEDCEYDNVRTRARFDLRTFASLRSAHWFIVSRGHTLFMPGHLTHKVITLEKYLGVSAFYVTLPNALSSLTRWHLNGAIYFKKAMWNDVAFAVRAQLDTVAAGPREAKHRWGFYHLGEALQAWERRHTGPQRAQMLSVRPFDEVAERIASYSH
jgi:hypothetical protein